MKKLDETKAGCTEIGCVFNYLNNEGIFVCKAFNQRIITDKKLGLVCLTYIGRRSLATATILRNQENS